MIKTHPPQRTNARLHSHKCFVLTEFVVDVWTRDWIDVSGTESKF